MKALFILLFAALVFGVCRIVDRAFTKAFRSKAQHMSGKAVRINKRSGVFGVVFCALGIAAITAGFHKDTVLFWGGFIVFLIGSALTVQYLGFGIFYDQESFLVSKLFRKSKEYHFSDIVTQKLYVITGGSIVIELHMQNRDAVSLQSTMDGVYPFLDTAFSAWCIAKNINPEECDFHDPSQSLWFPQE